MERLRGASAATLLAAAPPALGLFARGVTFGPVIDGVTLPGDPLRLLETGAAPPMPLLAGSNADEGSIFLPRLRVDSPSAYRAFLRRVFADRAPAVEALVPAATPADIRDALNRVLTLFSFAAPARALARASARLGKPSYLYHFTRRSHGTPGAGWLGAFHSAEIPYVFGTLGARAAADPTDVALSRAMGDAWVRFARTGDPGGTSRDEPHGGSPTAFPWPPHDAEGDESLEWGETTRVARGLHREACDLFEEMWRERWGLARPAPPEEPSPPRRP